MTDETSTTTNDNTSLRSLLEELPSNLCSHDYHLFCREERNLAALLYHLLLQEGGIEKFMKEIGGRLPTGPADVRVYFEYAHVRDLWHLAGPKTHANERDRANERYRDAIIALLQPPPALERYLRFDGDDGVRTFNEFFGAAPNASAASIQMPARWGKQPGLDWFRKNPNETTEVELIAFAKRAIVLKWAFNAKPDIVIHTSPTTAICIEAKLESKEAVYSAELVTHETPEPVTHEKFTMRQTEIQRFILEKLLGYETQFVFLSEYGQGPVDDDKRPKWQVVFEEQPTAVTHTDCSWKDVFSALAGTKEPSRMPFVSAWIDRIRNSPGKSQ